MRQATDASESDFLIIGGGSAGCVLASRLSEDQRSKVTLIEAGDDVEPEAVSDLRFRTLNDPRFLWPGLHAEYSKSGIGPLPFGQARILGGGSAINGMHAQRGLPADYDEWRELGVTGWGWDDVLPFFKKLEADQDFDGAEHGKQGPVPIRRVPDSSHSGLSRAIASVLKKRGVPHIKDINSEGGDGYGAVPLTISGDSRVSTVRAYLGPRVRSRPNLRIVTGRQVSRLLIENKRVVGAIAGNREHSQKYAARQTILTCGALHTAELLLRSGIGPGDQLTAAGIEVVADRPGVGQNLLNHPMMIFGVHLRRGGRQAPRKLHPCPFILRYSSAAPGCPATDMLLNVWERTPNTLAWDPLGRQVANLMIIINKVFSRGSLSLDASRNLQVQFNLLEDTRDHDRMVKSFYFIDELLREGPISRLVNAAFIPAMTPLALLLMQDNWKAQILSILGALALSGPESLRNRILEESGKAIADLLSDEASLRDFVKAAVLPSGHVAGTCRMGDPARGETVVDSRCRVIGVDGLRVADASIFPTLMAAGTNLPVIMAAEKVASMMKEDGQA